MSEMGARLRQVRQARGKSLAVVAGLAGISPGYLSRLEHGERPLDRRSLIVRLADALEIAPSDITGAELALPGEPEDDSAINAVRLALLAVSMDEPHGQAQPVEQLRARAIAVVAAQNSADTAHVGAALPALIRDLHSTANAQPWQPQVLRLLTLAHMQGTQAWLATVGAPMDLAWHAATLARRAAERLGEPVPLGVSEYGSALGLLSVGAFDMASRTVASTALPLVTIEHMQLAGSLAVASSLIAAARNDTTNRDALLEDATELAERTGETNMLGFGFGPSNVAVWRMQGTLETGEYADAATIAETINPDALVVPARRAVYWREYGRALARMPKRRNDAVLMLRRAERISPSHVQRHPLTRSVLAELLTRARRSGETAVGRELRGMAYRAGLPL